MTHDLLPMLFIQAGNTGWKDLTDLSLDRKAKQLGVREVYRWTFCQNKGIKGFMV